MLRRLPQVVFATTLGLFALTSYLTAAPPAPGTTPAPAASSADVKRNQEENLKLFNAFKEQLLRLAQRWEKSDNADDKERSKSLRAVLKLIEEKGLDKNFKDLVDGLGKNNPNGGDFNDLIDKDKKLREALNQILELLQTEDEIDRIRRLIAETKEAIKVIGELKRTQENIQAQTDGAKGDPNKIAQAQKDLADKTQKVADAINKTKGGQDAKGGDAGKPQDPKAETKAEAKPGENSGDAKPDTKENKSETKGDGKGMPMAGDPKAGDPKGAGDPKAGMPMGGDPKAGGEKPGDPKGGMDPKAGDPKAGGEPKPGGMMDPKNPPMGMPMGGDPKAGKPADGKPQESGKGDGKPSDPKAGGEGKPMSGEGMGMPMPGMGQPSPGSPKGGGDKPPPSGGQQKPKDPVGENVQQAVPQQQGAEDDINKGKNNDASKKQDKAIDELQKALAELEKRLKQLREKELAKLLANLEERVARMLKMQIEVREATVGIEKTVTALGGKPANAEIQKSQAEADKESQIVAEAEKTLKLMEGEGTAVVFAGVLKEVMGDMQAVQKRLNEARVGKDTQQIEQDIIDQLTMMKEALKKAKQEMENKPSDPKPGDPNAKKKDQSLIDLLNELKLVRALQDQLNKRTIMHNQKDPGEQAKDPIIQAELKQLAARQQVLQDMLHKIATQANQ